MSEDRDSAGILSSSAVMAAGTTVSRLSGFVRSALLVAALGTVLHAELFNVANTVPNMLYILLAGGIFNAVLVPQLVRSMKNDADGGEAYTNRIVTLAALFLAVVTVLLVVAAPWVMDVFLGEAYDQPELAAQRESVIDFARWCLPQVFFYGMFVLVGQILNARGRFGPMMWAPIANNLIAIAVLVTYLFVFGPAQGDELAGPFTPGQEALLGLGSTLGIVVQLAVLVPYLRQAGYRYRPRFDLRGTGLGHTLRLGHVDRAVRDRQPDRLHGRGQPREQRAGAGPGRARDRLHRLLLRVPDRDGPPLDHHRLAGDRDAAAAVPARPPTATSASSPARSPSSLRTALAVVVPFALLLPLVARDVAHVIWGYGAGAETYQNFAPTLALFGIGLVFFTVHYFMLRGFYALEQTRTVFFIQCVDRGHQHRRRRAAGARGHRRADLARAGARLRRVLPRRGRRVLRRPRPPAGWTRVPRPGALRGAARSWSRRSRPARRHGAAWLLSGLGEDPALGRRAAARDRGRGRRRGAVPGARPAVPPDGGHRRAGHGDAAAPVPLPGLTPPTMTTNHP